MTDDDSSSIAPSELEHVGDDRRKCALCHRLGDQTPNVSFMKPVPVL